MLNNKLTLLLLVVLASTAVLALIYNTDSRKDEYEVPYRIRGLGAGVAMLTQRSSLIGTTLVTGQTARQRFGVCATDTTRFMDDPSVGSCTGFLIAPDLLATAGTCVRDNNLNSLCSNIAVVFNYANTGTGITRTTFSSNEVFYCSSIVAVSQPRYLTTIINATTGLSRTDFIEAPNYAVIRLDRSVSFGISTYAYFRSLKNLHVNEKTYTIGHPLGLSKKYDDGGRIWAIDGGTTGRGIKFFSNSDTFTGSSGSPIFDADGRIIAMHASGNADFKMGRTTKCNSVISCPIGITQDDDDCWEGELGTSICYFAQWNSNIEDCSTAVGSKRNLPPGVNENIHRFNVTNPEVKAASDYYGVV